MKNLWIVVLLFLLPLEVLAMSKNNSEQNKFSLISSSFENQEWIPKIHACDRFGDNRSPKLEWKNPPSQTKSFALLCEDPDAPSGLFTHWVIYNIPAKTNYLKEGIVRQEKLPDGTIQGINSFRRLGYDGPCPPAGKPHHYIFTLYALDTMIDLSMGATSNDIKMKIKEHILEKTELTGIFQG